MNIPQSSLIEVIVSESVLDDTTSYGSGGLWEPYKIEGTPDELVNIWGKSTYDHFERLYNDPEDRAAAGVRFLSAFHLSETSDVIPIPSWSDIVDDFRSLSSEELNNFDSLVPKGTYYPKETFISGQTFKTYTVDQSYYLKYLTEKLMKRGVTFEKKSVTRIDEFDVEFDVVVNCCGIQGSNICGDEVPCYSIRGQVVRIK